MSTPCLWPHCPELSEVLDWCKPHAVDRADGLFGHIVKRRDRYRCRNCRSEQSLDCAHIFTRGRWQTRWDASNAVALCRPCHVHYTAHPNEWEDWCIEEAFGGDERAFHELEMLSTSTERGAPKVDLATVLLALEVG